MVAADLEALPVPRRTGFFRTVLFLIAGFPVRIAAFVLCLVFVVVGFATAVVGIGIPLLLAGTALLRGFTNLERRWVGRLLDTAIPPDESQGDAERTWQARLVESATWRKFGFVFVMLPVGIGELVIGILSFALPPFGLLVAPHVGSLHAAIAFRLLGPSRTAYLAMRTEHLQVSRARGVDAVEAERRRIERDLHDGAQQRLVALAIKLGRAQNKLDDPQAIGTLIDEAHADAKLAIAELRNLAKGIYPPVLTDRGLDAALSARVAQSPIPVDVEVDLDPRPPAAVETTAYFVVCEALANMAKHSGASRTTVRIFRSDADTVVVEVTDDGHGGAEVRAGGGLAGLADRVAMIDGVITVVSPQGGPTVLRADLPCRW